MPATDVVFMMRASLGRPSLERLRQYCAANLLGANVPLTGFRFQGDRYDCGTKVGWLQANLALAASDPELRPYLESVMAALKVPLAV